MCVSSFVHISQLLVISEVVALVCIDIFLLLLVLSHTCTCNYHQIPFIHDSCHLAAASECTLMNVSINSHRQSSSPKGQRTHTRTRTTLLSEFIVDDICWCFTGMQTGLKHPHNLFQPLATNPPQTLAIPQWVGSGGQQHTFQLSWFWHDTHALTHCPW